MPGPIIADPTPGWLKPENASVTDTALMKAMRMIGHLIGADNPTAQVFSLMMTEIPGGAPTGGLAKAVEGLKERVIKAYHGSPHDFERFSLEKIGTGEGAQAYGHGLYFAEQEQTAKTYRDILSGRITGGYSKPEDALVHASTDFRNHGYTKEQAIPELKKAYPWAADQHLEDAWYASNPGKMYEVAIHADPEDFLDWDKPLSQQSEKVKQKLGSLGFEPKPTHKWEAHQITQADIDEKLFPSSYAPGSWTSVVRDPMGKVEWHGGQLWGSRQPAEDNAALRTGLDQRALRDKGSEIYHDVGTQTKAEAASKLREAGIPGIKYLDQGSRAAGEGSRNYVVFDDRLIDILKKYGLLLPAAGLGADATIQGPAK